MNPLETLIKRRDEISKQIEIVYLQERPKIDLNLGYQNFGQIIEDWNVNKKECLDQLVYLREQFDISIEYLNMMKQI